MKLQAAAAAGQQDGGAGGGGEGGEGTGQGVDMVSIYILDLGLKGGGSGYMQQLAAVGG